MLIKKLLLYISKTSRSLAKNISSADRQRNQLLKEWKKEDGSKNLRLSYPTLNKDSIVFDLGGYKGDWASDIFSMYLCKIYVFEPHPEYYKNIVNRFAKNSKINVYEFGLGARNEMISMSTDEESSSAYIKGGDQKEAELKSFSEFIVSEEIAHIHLMKINIEGGEYDLLDHVIEKNLTKKIDNFQIQFHHFVPEAEMRMKAIQQKLSETHELTYSYNFFWENWRLKKI